MAPSYVLYVYGFQPRMSQEEFSQKFFEQFSEDYCEKVDFKGDKIYAFVHTKTLEQANELINYWNGRKMEGGQHALQVRHKGQNNHGGNNQPQFGNAVQQKQQDPVLYVYGFPKGMAEEQFTNEFFMNSQEACKKVDFFSDKLYAFVHCHTNSQCDDLIMAWDGKMMNGSKRPLQVRYKGENNQAGGGGAGGQNQNNQWVNMPPVVWVYGFPPKTQQDAFCQEFFLQFPKHLKKIDFYEKKLYAFVHCHTSAQARDLINHWDGKMMQNSTQPLQVRFKGNNMKSQGQMQGGNGMNFGQNQFYGQGYSQGGNGQFFPNGNMNQMMKQQGQMMQPNHNQFGMQFGMPMQGQQQFQPQQQHMQQQQGNGGMQNFQGMPQNGGWGGMMVPQQQFNPNGGQYGMNGKRNGNGPQNGGQGFQPNQQQQFMHQGNNQQPRNGGFNQGGQPGQPGMVGGPQHKKGRFN